MTNPVVDYMVEEDYKLTIQDQFDKKAPFAAWEIPLAIIIAYTECHHPKRFTR